eukprot:TRINITY_DN11110_c1_g1_i1.p1 TRINITY_DN11110_c1_g1~~TRINITY_DN11110_c1_g1_i1.p1  ORF type:complete len:100 (-),score=12.24 TRINITY_DN11110_c1_g1_i1:105-404(-)
MVVFCDGGEPRRPSYFGNEDESLHLLREQDDDKPEPSCSLLCFSGSGKNTPQSPDLLQKWLESGDKQTSSVFPPATVPLDPQRAWILHFREKKTTFKLG